MPITDQAAADETASAAAQTVEEHALQRHRDALRDRFPMPEPHTARTSRAGIAATLALIAVAALLWLDPAYRHEHHETRIGERREVTLADGSQVTLNTATRVDVSWHLRSRRAVLDDGQALFEISPNRLRPFRTEAGEIEVRVLGTAFDLRHDAQRTQVGVLHGRVAVKPRDGTGGVVLTPGQQVALQDGRLGTLQAFDVATASTWTDGRVVFERTPLAEVVAELQRYHRAPIVLADAELADVKVSGVLAIDQAGAMLELLPQVLSTPVQVTTAAGGSVRIEALRR